MCIVVLIGAFAPRFALFLTWIFSDRISQAIDSWLLSFVGFLFLPFTTLFYVVAWAPVSHVSGFGWIFVFFGFMLDMGNYGSSSAYNSKRRQSV